MSVLLRTRKLKNGTITYYLDIHHSGDRYREFLNAKIKKATKSDSKTEIKRIAEAIRAQRELELIRDGYGIPDIQKSTISFTKYFIKFKDSYKKNDVRKINSTFKKYKEHFGNISAKQLTKNKCKAFLEFLQNHADIDSDETVRSYFGVFRKVINAAVDDGLFKTSPAKGITVRIAKDQLKKQVLTFDEIQELNNTECGNNEVKRAFMFCLNTGLGLSEIKRLQWKHIQNKKLSHFNRSKTKTALNIDLNDNARYFIGERGKLKDYLFNLPTNNGCNKVLKTWVKRTTIDKHITWYCSRHTFACNLILTGANPKTVSKLMGHTSISMVDKYLNHVDQLNKKAVNSLPTINHLKKVV